MTGRPGYNMGKLSIKRPETYVSLCLDMSLRADWETLDEQLREARKKTTGDRLTGNAEAARLAEQIGQLEQRMAEETVRFRLRALPRNRWAELVNEHPARQDDDADKNLGVNRETFFDAVITATDKAGVPETIMSVRDHNDELVDFELDDWEQLADDMTDQQYADFANAAWMINRGRASIPFSHAASRMTQTSDET